MWKTPPDCVSVHYEPEEKARSLALGSGGAEIGIGSFMDNAKSRRFEKQAIKRKFSVKSGEVGRPRKSKNHKSEASLGKKKVLREEGDEGQAVTLGW